nr:MAG TPA: hypothetical protein [Caudoviricetes sp.]
MYEHGHVLAYIRVKDSPYHTSRLSWPVVFAIPVSYSPLYI